ASGGNAEIIRALLSRGARIEAAEGPGQSALLVAAANGHIEAVRVLLDGGADVNARDPKGVSALLLAAGNGHTEIARLLLEHRADPNTLAPQMTSDSQPTNGHAREQENTSFESGAAPALAGQGTTPLMVASLHGHISIVEALLAGEADPN